MFEVSAAKREILQKLVERDWTPTDLAEDLDKSPETIYNHLNDLAERGILSKRQVAAKTRPKTEYSIGEGFIQYIAVLPGQYRERILELDESKAPIVRIWNVPQQEFHPYLENFWWSLKHDADIDLRKDITAVAIYGSVARGTADRDSDIDVLVVTENATVEEFVNGHFGALRLETNAGSKIAIAEVYTKRDYRNSLVHGSDFLRNVRDEMHIVYDPINLLRRPEGVIDEF